MNLSRHVDAHHEFYQHLVSGDGDNVHVGSNCVLVAPLEIGAGATIGGGSTIVNGAPGEALTLARARQISIAGWQRPAKKPKSTK